MSWGLVFQVVVLSIVACVMMIAMALVLRVVILAWTTRNPQVDDALQLLKSQMSNLEKDVVDTASRYRKVVSANMRQAQREKKAERDAEAAETDEPERTIDPGDAVVDVIAGTDEGEGAPPKPTRLGEQRELTKAELDARWARQSRGG